MGKFVDLTGQKFGRLVVIKRNPENGTGNHARWDCICECGNERTVYSNGLRRGNSLSCGCYRRENITILKRKHGLHGIDGYTIWVNMVQRCTNKKDKHYKNYGGRGISVCDRWRSSFELFIQDMGLRPSHEHSIDRIEVNGNYEPNNCKWSTKEEQARNTRIRKSNTSGVQGVNWHKTLEKWVARINYKGKRIFLGNFTSLEEATNIRCEAELKYWGKSS